MGLRRGVRRAVRRTGWDLVRVTDPAPKGLTPLELAMAAALSARGSLRIVQVGANDGINSDPLEQFLSAHRDSVSCVFIEPQELPLRILQEHHAAATDFAYVRAAVSPSGTLRLYTVASSAWPDLNVDYADPKWPDYRAPSGIASAHRERVRDWLTRHYAGQASVDNLIEAHDVPSAPLAQLLRENGWTDGPQVLQIDTEGYDDEVLYASSIDTYLPWLINYEHVHLDQARRQRCEEHLTDLGYRLTDTGQDTLAVRW